MKKKKVGERKKKEGKERALLRLFLPPKKKTTTFFFPHRWVLLQDLFARSSVEFGAPGQALDGRCVRWRRTPAREVAEVDHFGARTVWNW